MAEELEQATEELAEPSFTQEQVDKMV